MGRAICFSFYSYRTLDGVRDDALGVGVEDFSERERLSPVDCAFGYETPSRVAVFFTSFGATQKIAP